MSETLKVNFQPTKGIIIDFPLKKDSKPIDSIPAIIRHLNQFEIDDLGVFIDAFPDIYNKMIENKSIEFNSYGEGI